MGQIENLGTAIITGASAGLGSLFAEKFAARGYNLKLVARRADRLSELATRLQQQYGIKADPIVADLSNLEEVEALAKTLEADEQISVLVNNAGIATLGKSLETSTAQQLAMIQLNATAVTLLSTAVLKGFKKRNIGTLINIASILGVHSLDFTAIYAGTKAYVVNYTRGLQEEVKDTDIHIQLVLPSATATDIWEIGGVPLSNLDPATVMKAEDCVNAVLKGLDQGEQLTFPSVEDQDLINRHEELRVQLFKSAQNSQPASRYQ